MLENCQIFTPNQYSLKLLDIVGYGGKHILGKTLLENSCGEGNILIYAVEKYIRVAKKEGYSLVRIKKDLEKNFIGFEIDDLIRRQCLEKLNNKAKEYEIFNVKWNILNEDYLKFELSEKVDYIVGNPPYIMYQSIDKEERKYLRNKFITCLDGKFDYCYPFIEKSINDLNSESGKMSYLIPTSIFKNVFGKNLRNYMLPYLKKIYDFKETNVFENVLVAPSFIYLSKGRKSKYISYHDMDNSSSYRILKEDLDNKKWVFSTNKYLDAGQTLGDYCKISNTVATLLNQVFVIKDYENKDSKYIKIENGIIEKGVLRKAASPRSEAYLKNELIIFPYYYSQGTLMHYKEEEFKFFFPKAYEYLLTKKDKLDRRDSDRCASWFEYGRSQALSSMNNRKLLISSVVTNKIKIFELSEDVIPYSGFYIIPNSNVPMNFVKEVMESEQFYSYIQDVGINASGSSLRFSVKDFLNFPLILMK